MDDTEIPGIPTTVGYVDLRDTSIEEVCELVLRKLSYEKVSESVGPDAKTDSTDVSLEDRVMEAIRSFYDITGRFPNKQELALRTATVPSKAERMAYQSAMKTGWRPPTREEIAEAAEALQLRLCMIATSIRDKKDLSKDDREFVEKHSELIPTIDQDGNLGWPNAIAPYLPPDQKYYPNWERQPKNFKPRGPIGPPFHDQLIAKSLDATIPSKRIEKFQVEEEVIQAVDRLLEQFKFEWDSYKADPTRRVGRKLEVAVAMIVKQLSSILSNGKTVLQTRASREIANRTRNLALEMGKKIADRVPLAGNNTDFATDGEAILSEVLKLQQEISTYFKRNVF